MSKKILVLSDSHGKDANIKRVLRKEGPVDMCLHLGDAQCSEGVMERLAGCPVMMIAGNCDMFCNLSAI